MNEIADALRRMRVREAMDIMNEALEDPEETNQKYHSSETSINSSKLPAIYKLVPFKKGQVVLDYGGGKFDNGIEYLRSIGCKGYVYDPYNRTSSYNQETLKAIRSAGGADIVLISNVLNVIEEESARQTVLKNAKRLMKSGGKCYITVYEGKGNGIGAVTQKGGSYQLNKKTADYVDEIQRIFGRVNRKSKLIIAESKKMTEAQMIDLSNITLKDIENAKYHSSFMHDRAQISFDDAGYYVKIGKNRWEYSPMQAHALGDSHITDKEIYQMVITRKRAKYLNLPQMTESKKMTEASVTAGKFSTGRDKKGSYTLQEYSYNGVKYFLRIWEYNAEAQITSSHPYDDAEYHWAYVEDFEDFRSMWNIVRDRKIVKKVKADVEAEDIIKILAQLDKSVKPVMIHN